VNISQGLKQKNKLVAKLNVLTARIVANNQWQKGNTPAYDAKALIEERDQVIAELLDLKVRISNATQPIVRQIFLQGELKSYVKSIRSMPVQSGMVNDRFSSVAPIEKEVCFTEVQRDKMVEHTEKQIDTLQDIIDKHNATTEI